MCWDQANKKLKSFNYICFNSIQDGPFEAAHGWEGAKSKRPPHSKICHTYPTMMKPFYLNKIQTIYKSRDTPLEFLHQLFFSRNQELLLYQEIQT